jgi:hypothetical protein
MNPIFGYQASTELNDDSWKSLVVASSLVPKDEVKSTFGKWEQEFKEETKQPLPGAWRSAKSVILSAHKEGIPLTDGTNVRGKTAVEKDIRKHKSVTKMSTPEDELAAALCAAYAIAEKYGLKAVMSKMLKAFDYT